MVAFVTLSIARDACKIAADFNGLKYLGASGLEGSALARSARFASCGILLLKGLAVLVLFPYDFESCFKRKTDVYEEYSVLGYHATPPPATW